MAITSLVLAGLAFPGLCCYGVPAIPLGFTALILGRISLGRIRNSNGALGGEGIAQAGWIVGLVAGSIGVLVLVFYILFVVLAIGATILGAPSSSPT